MASIGEQIKSARKSKGLTQDALADALNVTRAAVANWEQDRRLPDAETLLRLSKALCYNFETETAQISEESALLSDEERGQGDGPAGTEAERADAGAPDPLAEKRRRGRLLRVLLIAASALAVIALILWLAVFPALEPKDDKPPKDAEAVSAKASDAEGEDEAGARPYKAPVSERYTAALFMQEAENEAGKAYLRVEPSLNVSPGENYDYWLFTFNYHEINGVPLSVDRVEQVYFAKEKENVEMIVSAADIRAYGLETDIPAFGEWAWTGGLPVQNTVLGVGVLLRATDANGQALCFTAYIPFGET